MFLLHFVVGLDAKFIVELFTLPVLYKEMNITRNSFHFAFSRRLFWAYVGIRREVAFTLLKFIQGQRKTELCWFTVIHWMWIVPQVFPCACFTEQKSIVKSDFFFFIVVSSWQENHSSLIDWRCVFRWYLWAAHKEHCSTLFSAQVHVCVCALLCCV